MGIKGACMDGHACGGVHDSGSALAIYYARSDIALAPQCPFDFWRRNDDDEVKTEKGVLCCV